MSQPWFDSIVDLIVGVSWPLVVAFVVFLFRDVIRRRLEDLKRVEGGGLSADFEARIVRAEDAAESAREERSDAEVAPVVHRESLIEDLLKVHGNSAFLAAFSDLEAILRDAADDANVPLPRLIPLSAVIRELQKREILYSEGADAISQLATIRNDIAHAGAPNLGFDEARRLVEATALMSGIVSGIVRGRRAVRSQSSEN